MSIRTATIICAVLVLSARVADGGLAGSAHDFSRAAWNTTGDSCVACHNSPRTPGEAPIWNHATTTLSFTVYTSRTMNATVRTPSRSSLMCLSCHDGVTAVDSFGGNMGTAVMTGPAVLGTDLRKHHPISIVYDSGLVAADGGLRPVYAPSGLGNTIAADLLVEGMVECSSCHDVHDSARIPFMLVKPNYGSALCLTCHDK